MSGFGATTLRAMPPFVCRLEWKGKQEVLSTSRDPIKVAEARISGPIVKLVFQVGATVY